MFDYYRLRLRLLKQGQLASEYSLRGPVAGLGVFWWIFSVFLGGALRNEFAVIAFFAVGLLFSLAYITEDYKRYGRLIVGGAAIILLLLLLGAQVYQELSVNWPLVRSRTRYDQIVERINIARWFVGVGSAYFCAIGILGIRSHLMLRQKEASPQ